MPDTETREVFAVNASYVIVVKDAQGHFIRLEPGGVEQIMWPYGHNLDQKIEEKNRELQGEPK